MTLIEQKAREVAAQISDKPEIAIITIITIIEIIVELVKLVRNCKATPTAAIDKLQNPSIFVQAKARSVIRRKMEPANRDKTEKAVFAIGSKSTVEEMTTMFAEAEEK